MFCFVFSLLPVVKHSKQMDVVPQRETGPQKPGAPFQMVSGLCLPCVSEAGQSPAFAGKMGSPCVLVKCGYHLNLICLRKGKMPFIKSPREQGRYEVSFLCPFANSRFLITNAQKKRKLNPNPNPTAQSIKSTETHKNDANQKQGRCFPGSQVFQG